MLVLAISSCHRATPMAERSCLRQRKNAVPAPVVCSGQLHGQQVEGMPDRPVAAPVRCAKPINSSRMAKRWLAQASKSPLPLKGFKRPSERPRVPASRRLPVAGPGSGRWCWFGSLMPDSPSISAVAEPRAPRRWQHYDAGGGLQQDSHPLLQATAHDGRRKLERCVPSRTSCGNSPNFSSADPCCGIFRHEIVARYSPSSGTARPARTGCQCVRALSSSRAPRCCGR